MIELSNASEAKLYFEKIIKEMNGIKISSVFSLCPSFNNNIGYRRYREDTPVYIIFENGKCLIIEYRFIDSLCVELRSLNEEENELFEKALIKDFFNCTVDLHRYNNGENSEATYIKYATATISLEYDTLSSVELCPVTKDYEKWINGNIDYVAPTPQTFDEIKFKMSNGNTFILCADNAIFDGYVSVWSLDAKESSIKL